MPEVDPADLQIVKTEYGFSLNYDGSTLRTEGKSEVRHAAQELLVHMVAELDSHGMLTIEDGVIVAPQFMNSYRLLGIQKDWVEQGRDNLTLFFGERLLFDPIFHSVAGPEQVDQMSRWIVAYNWLGERRRPIMSAIHDLDINPRNLNDPFRSKDAITERAATDETILGLKRYCLSLEPEVRTIVMFLHAMHEGVLVFPLMLATGACSPSEYANGVLASHDSLSTAFGDIDGAEQGQYFGQLRDNARTALDYVEHYQRGLPNWEVRRILERGENESTEFKSTLRWNIRAKKNDDMITHASLKTIAAFLNSSGGDLLIGVADDGTIHGLADDRFPSDDKYLLHLFNVVKSWLGDGATSCITARISALKEGQVCHVHCKPSDVPVFCKSKKGEQFFVRTGPGTTEIAPSAIVPYMKKRFET